MKTVLYWISTVVISAFMLFIAFSYLTHQPNMMTAFATLGYPSYFPNILGIFKVLGAIALLVPRFPRLKEWAYAGFTFTFIGAFISHLAVGQNHEALMPVIAMVVLAISYWTLPAGRQLPSTVAFANKTTVIETGRPANVSI